MPFETGGPFNRHVYQRLTQQSRWISIDRRIPKQSQNDQRPTTLLQIFCGAGIRHDHVLVMPHA